MLEIVGIPRDYNRLVCSSMAIWTMNNRIQFEELKV